MAVAGALIPLLLKLLPYLGAAGAYALGVTAYLTGAGAKLQDALEQLSASSGMARVLSWLDVRDDLRQLFTSPLAQEALRSYGVVPEQLRAQAETAIANQIRAEIPVIAFPAFTSYQAADQWYAFWISLYTQGIISEDVMRGLYAHYQGQLAALRMPAELGYGEVALPMPAPTPVLPAPAPSPITALGPGQMQITVRIPALIDSAAIGQALSQALAPTLSQLAEALQAWERTTSEGFGTLGNTLGATAPALGMTLLQALPLLGASFAESLLRQGQNLGHSLQLGRNQCLGGTASALLQQLLPSVLGVFSMQMLRSESGIGGFITDQARNWFEGALDPARFPRPATPETVFSTATARLKEAMSFGLQAHMWAVMAESSYILKNLGLPQVAGFLAEMAGFNRLAAATLGQVENAALSIPMRQLALRTYTPNIPGIGDLEDMYAKKEIPLNARHGIIGLREALALSGYSDDWIKVYAEYLWRDPRLGEVIRIGQFFSPALVEALARPTSETADWMRHAGIDERYIDSSDWYFAWRAAKGGYDPRDVAILTETAKRAVARREQTLFLDGITRLARDGFISLEKADGLVKEAWEFSNPLTARRRAIELQQDYKVLSDSRAVVLMSLSRGLLTRDEARDLLAGLDMDGQRVELEILKSTLGMVPGVRLTISRPEEVLEEAGLEVE